MDRSLVGKGSARRGLTEDFVERPHRIGVGEKQEAEGEGQFVTEVGRSHTVARREKSIVRKKPGEAAHGIVPTTPL